MRIETTKESLQAFNFSVGKGILISEQEILERNNKSVFVLIRKKKT